MTQIEFTDPNFRLACLDALFDNGHFKDELARILEIPDFEDGFEVNPDRMQAMAQLPIRQEHLDEIEHFCPDGGDDVYEHVFPQWTGEEDELYIQSFADLKLLRNVRFVTIHSVTCRRAFDLSLLLSLEHLAEIDTDYYYVSTDSDIDAALTDLAQRGVEISISGKRRNE